MRIGILSDIHGNIDALRAVLDAASRSFIDRLFVLGDVVGYYYQPALCLDLLDEWDTVWICGNHEVMLEQARRDPEAGSRIKSLFGSGIEVALNTLPGHRLDWLSNLPETTCVDVKDKRTLLCHGSPWCVDEYVYPDVADTVRDKIAAQGFDFVFMGHTHHPFIWSVANCQIANPGSVGQPRNRQPGAHWLIWDTAAARLIPRSEPYDATALFSECEWRDPDRAYLRDVLTRTGDQ